MSAPASSAAAPDLGALREILAQAEKRLAAELRAKEIIDNKSYLLIGGGFAVVFFVLSDNRFVEALLRAHDSFLWFVAACLLASAVGLGFLISVVWALQKYGALGAEPSKLWPPSDAQAKDGYAAMLARLAVGYEKRINLSRKNNARKVRFYKWGRALLLPSAFALIILYALIKLSGG